MHIIINNSSMVPIYEQIIDQIKSAIIRGELQPDTVLPSVRSLSKELKISALTVKKAYANLEEEGFTVTVHGKGTYVAATNKNLMREEQLKEVEHDLEQAIMKGRTMSCYICEGKYILFSRERRERRVKLSSTRGDTTPNPSGVGSSNSWLSSNKAN